MYWSQWGPGRIDRASMDGTNRTIFVHSQIIQPSGLTIDHLSHVIYWSDMIFDRIERINLDGSNRMVRMEVPAIFIGKQCELNTR